MRARAAVLALAGALLAAALISTWMLAGTLEFLPGGIVGGRLAGPVLAGLLLLYLLGLGAWALAPERHWTRAAAAAFAALKIIVYVFGAHL